MEAIFTPNPVPPPSLASALVAGDLDGLIGLLERLDAQRASIELSGLLDLLTHPAIDVARAAAVACCRVKLAAAVSRLRGMLTDGDSVVGGDVLAAIEGWMLPDWIESYRQLLEMPDFPWKGQVLQNLGHHGSADAARLLAAWATSPEPELAIPALVGLRRFPSMVHYRLAREALAHASPDVSIEAARTVVAVGGRSALREQLRWALAASRDVQQETLSLARSHGDAKLGPDLEPWLVQPDDTVVAGALATLRALRATPSSRALAGCLGNADSRVRSGALLVAPLLPGRDAAELLERGLADAAASVQCAAVEALAELRTPRAIELLHRALSAPAASTRVRALAAFYSIGSEDAPSLARQLLSDSAAEVRRAALDHLGRSGDQPEPERLQSLLNDSDSAVREDARRLSTGGRSGAEDAGQLAAAGYTAQAASLLVTDIVEHGEDPRSLFQLGILLYGRGSYETALEKFMRAVELEPDHSGALRYVAWTQEQLGNRQAQLDAARRLCELAPGETWAQRLLGLEAAVAGNHADVRERLGRVAAAEPEDREVAFHFGAALLALGQLDAARRSLERSVSDPAFAARSHELLAEAALRQENSKDAEHHLKQVVGADPAAAPQAACALARLWLGQDRAVEAARLMEPLARQGDAPALAWLLGAEAALLLDRPAAALAWIERCPRLPEQDDRRRWLRGEALRQVGRLAEALAELAFAAAVDGAGAERLLALGRCQEAMGESAAALESIGRYVRAAGRTEPEVRLLEARLLRRAGRASEAIEVLDPLAAWDQPDPEYHLESARCHLLLGAAGPALRHARLHGEAAPDSTPGALVMGEALLAAGDLEAARRHLQALASLPAAPPESRRLLFTTLHRLGEHALASETGQTLLESHREDAAFCAELGGSYQALEKWTYAAEWLSRAARLAPAGRELLGRLADVALRSGRFREALEHATALCERHADDVHAMRLRGLALLALERSAEAVPYLRTAFERASADETVRSALARALVRVREDAAALALYPDNAAVEAASEDALIALASAMDRKGQLARALELFDVRARRVALSPAAVVLFSQLCVQDGDPVRAEGILNTALKSAPDEAGLLEARAEMKLHRGRLRAAEPDLARALQLEPDRPRALRLLGELKLALGLPAEAASLLERHARAGGGDARCYLQLGRAHAAQEQPERAEKAFRTAIDLDGQDAEIASELALTLAAAGRREEARGFLSEFAAGRAPRLEALCARAAEAHREARTGPARWMRRELAALGAPVRLALVPLVLDDVREGRERDAWSAILELGSRSPDAMPVLASELLAAGRAEMAREVYRRSFELNGRNVSDLMGVARCHHALGDQARALAVLAEVASRDPQDVEAAMLTAQIRRASGQRHEARAALDRVLAAKPDHTAALEMAVELHLDAGEVDRAAALVDACLARDFGRAELHLFKAAVCKARKQFDEAADAMLWAAGLDPANEHAGCEAALFLQERGDSRGARDVLSRLLSANPQSRRGRLQLARLMVRESDLEAVLREWHEAERRHGLDDEETEAFVTALWAAGEDEEADRRVHRLRAENPASPRGWLLSARIALRRSNDAAAVEFLSEAAKRSPSSLEAHTGLAGCFERLGQLEAAVRHAGEAAALAPNDALCALRFGRLLLAAGRATEAVTVLETVVARSSSDPAPGPASLPALAAGQDPAPVGPASLPALAAGQSGSETGEALQEARLLLARACVLSGNRARAVELLLALPEPGAPALGLLADAYYEDRDYEAAADAFGRLAALAGTLDLDAQRRRLESCLRAGRLADAAEVLRDRIARLALRAGERAGLAGQVAELAERLCLEERPGEAAALAGEALERMHGAEGPARATLLLAAARAERAAGRLEAADAFLERGLSDVPVDDRVLDALAELHAVHSTSQRLRERMLAVLSRQPDCARAYLYLGAAYCGLCRPDAAKQACERAARLAPASRDFHFGLAQAAEQAGDLESAVDAYRRVLELGRVASNASGESAWLALARASRGTGDVRRETAVEAVIGLADCLERLGRPAEALPHAEEAVKLAGDDPALRYRLCRLLVAANRSTEAAVILEQMLPNAGPVQAQARLLFSRVTLGSGNRAFAVELLAGDPEPATDSLQMLADLHYEDARWEAAADAYGRLAAAAGSLDAVSERRRVDCCARSGRLVEAAGALRGLLVRQGADEAQHAALASRVEELVEQLCRERREHEAAGLAEEALAAMPGAGAAPRGAVLLALARACEAAGKRESAGEALERALQTDPVEDRVLDRVAAFHVADQSLERLRDRMLAVTRRQPARALAHVYLGAALCRLGQPGAGQEACTRAARLAPASVPANLGLARAANQAGDHETSVRALRRILELEPGHEAAWMELADTYDAAGLSALALEHCQQMLAFSGGQGPVARRARKVLSKLGNRSVGSPMSRPDVETEMQQCLSEGRWAEARAYAESLLRLNPYHLRALLAQGEVALQANNLDHASRSIRTAAAQYPGCPTAHALLARLLELEGNAPAARSEAFRAHELEPAGAQTASLLARLLGQDGQDEAAETVLRETLAACGRPEEGLRLALALCLEKRGDLAGALQALSTPPVDSPEALAHFARLLEAAGDLESAGRIHLQQLGTFAVAPRRAAAEFARKCVLEGKRPLAIAVARQVARSGDVPVTICSDLARTAPADSPDPGLGALLDAALAHLPISVTTSERTGLVVALARQLRLAGRPAEASRRLKEAIELNPADPPAQQELADLLRQGGELARMQTAFERIAGRAPDSMHAWLHLAEARIALRRGLPAQEAAARAVALDAGSFEAHLTFARACRLTQDYARAIAAYRQALRLRPNDPRTLCELAACYGASGLHELAGGHWRRVLEHAPRGSRLARAAWRFLGKAEVES